jgi:hypothetical protein
MTDYSSLIGAIRDEDTRAAVEAVWLGGREVGRALQDAEAEIESLKRAVIDLQRKFTVMETPRQ